MHTIKEVLRLTAAGLSQRQIAQSLDLSNGVVAKYQAAAQRASLSWPLPAELDDEAWPSGSRQSPLTPPMVRPTHGARRRTFSTFTNN